MSSIGASAAAVPSAQAAPYDAATILVRFARGASPRAEISAAGDQPAGTTANGVSIVRIGPGRNVTDRVVWYRQRAGVVYAEPNYIARTELDPPDDPGYPSQWALSAIEALAGWSVHPSSYSATGPTIGIVDTGVDLTHPDLSEAVLASAGANCLPGVCSAGPALDDSGHGTHVAGIAAAVTNNGAGIAGVAIGSPIVPVKVLDSQGSGNYAAVASGILWAVDQGARVVNLSLGGYGYSTTLCNAVSEAFGRGALVVAAAGNDGTSQALYPAACPGAVGVAATNASNGSPSWSNWGEPDVFVSAPGESIYSTYWQRTGSTYATRSGTSMAAPHVSGLAALLVGQGPTRTTGELKAVLAGTATKVGTSSYGQDPYGTCACSWNEHYGYGLIDVKRALAGTPVVSFADVPVTSPHFADIGQLYERGITQGCGKNASGELLFCPKQDVPREQTAAFLVRAKGLTPSLPATATFADVPTSDQFFGEIERMYEQGITQGCGRNASGELLFCPKQDVPREQMAAFLARAKGLTPYLPATATFADVPTSDQFFGEIERLYEQGITQGCGRNASGELLFCPKQKVPREQMASFLIRAFP